MHSAPVARATTSRSPHNEFGYDFVFWSMMDSQTAFLNGDIPAQVEQLALSYDSRVEAGDLEPRTRTFSAPAGAVGAGRRSAARGHLGVVLLFLSGCAAASSPCSAGRSDDAAGEPNATTWTLTCRRSR